MTFYQLRVIERLWGSRKFAVGHHHSSAILNSIFGYTINTIVPVEHIGG
jgi:hypothetical protein